MSLDSTATSVDPDVPRWRAGTVRRRARLPVFKEPSTVLTRREKQTLIAMADGLSNKLISVKLDISENTAKFHVRNAIAKLGCTTRTEAVALALRTGIIK